MKTAPYFAFYPHDFMFGVMLMNSAQTGGYIKLLCFQWEQGQVPADPAQMAKIAGVSLDEMPGILEKFPETAPGVRLNARLEMERAKVVGFFERQRDNGSKGGRPPGKKNPTTEAPKPKKPTGSKKKTQPEPTPNPSESESESDTETSLPPSPLKGEGVTTAKDIVELWNAKAGELGLPKGTLTDKRKRTLNARLHEKHWPANFVQALGKVHECAFLMGDGERGWRANLDFMLRPDSVTSILEGKYRAAPESPQVNGKPASGPPPAPVSNDPPTVDEVFAYASKRTPAIRRDIATAYHKSRKGTGWRRRRGDALMEFYDWHEDIDRFAQIYEKREGEEQRKDAAGGTTKGPGLVRNWGRNGENPI